MRQNLHSAFLPSRYKRWTFKTFIDTLDLLIFLTFLPRTLAFVRFFSWSLFSLINQAKFVKLISGQFSTSLLNKKILQSENLSLCATIFLKINSPLLSSNKMATYFPRIPVLLIHGFL